MKFAYIFITVLVIILVAVLGFMYLMPEKQPNVNPPLAPFASGNIKLNSIRPGSEISAPLIIEGEAKGYYFEASFPVKLFDGNDKEIAQGLATAQGDWMVDAFVPFKATINFTAPTTKTGTLVFMKDNPSGLPENDENVSVSISFKEVVTSENSCVISGCSRQICANEDVISTCEYKEEYACYTTAKCERQNSGNCGWTETPELKSCLSE